MTLKWHADTVPMVSVQEGRGLEASSKLPLAAETRDCTLPPLVLRGATTSVSQQTFGRHFYYFNVCMMLLSVLLHIICTFLLWLEYLIVFQWDYRRPLISKNLFIFTFDYNSLFSFFEVIFVYRQLLKFLVIARENIRVTMAWYQKVDIKNSSKTANRIRQWRHVITLLTHCTVAR